MQLHFENLRGWVSPANAFIALYVEMENAFWIDREHATGDRFSVIGTGTPIDVQSASDLDGFIENYDEVSLPFAFRPGLVGWLDFEQVAPKFLRVESAMVFDHDNRGIYLIAKTNDDAKFRHWLDAALLRIGLIGGETLKYLASVSESQFSDARPRHSDSEYLELIGQAQDHIAAGDVYQICLTNQYEITAEADPLAVFLSLRETNPAPYAGFYRIDGVTLVCSSPEQFLKVDVNGLVTTKPIKGTRPRGLNPDLDELVIEELSQNKKERAENLMIVDLMRNDLSRVCEVDSVTVTSLFEVETYATVHQLVSTVQGQLSQNQSALDALQAAFPGGSMTGAPKLRAIEIIRELERGERGVYSGVVGFLADNGSADFGMVIRSLVFEPNRITLGVGGGITIDSNPIEELAETKLKAKALLRALKAPDILG